MRIPTPGHVAANFFMKSEETQGINALPHVMPSQVHGKNIITINAANFPEYILPSRPEADGVLLTTSRAGASLRFADCTPVMLWGSSWVMILHSGYKGTVLNISSEGLGLIRGLFGHDEVNGAHAWVGPCIGREYFRKSGEEWTVRGVNAFHRENYDVDGERVYFDLAGEIHAQLRDCGLVEDNITLSGIDTLEDERCCSYRRGDVHERMMLHVRLMKE
ncbi:MAG: polyphenol oxidase family protein [Synergistaceae bacterium]|nr:polyphenol oxidase family protein [Synergistaceae bacterium]